MGRLSRREFTGLLGSAAAVSLSGCTEAFGEYLGNDQEGEFLVVTTNLLHSPGYRWEDAQYPDDIVARIAVENRRADRQRATLEATLTNDPPDGESEEWTKTRELNQSRGSSPTIVMIFDSVYEDGDDFDNYEIEARIVEPDRADEESAQ